MMSWLSPFSASVVIFHVVFTTALVGSYCQVILVSRGIAYAYLWKVAMSLGAGSAQITRNCELPENVTFTELPLAAN